MEKLMIQESLVFHCPGEMGSHRGLGLTSSVVTEEKAEKMVQVEGAG